MTLLFAAFTRTLHNYYTQVDPIYGNSAQVQGTYILCTHVNELLSAACRGPPHMYILAATASVTSDALVLERLKEIRAVSGS